MRRLTGWSAWVAGGIALAASLYHIHAVKFGLPEPRVMRGWHLAFLIPLTLLLYPARRTSPPDQPSVPDLLLAVAAAVACLFIVVEAPRLNQRWEGASPVLPIELALGTVLTLVLLEATRRAVSAWMAAIMVVCLGYFPLGPYLPGILHHRGSPFPRSSKISTSWPTRGSSGC